MTNGVGNSSYNIARAQTAREGGGSFVDGQVKKYEAALGDKDAKHEVEIGKGFKSFDELEAAVKKLAANQNKDQDKALEQLKAQVSDKNSFRYDQKLDLDKILTGESKDVVKQAFTGSHRKDAKEAINAKDANGKSRKDQIPTLITTKDGSAGGSVNPDGGRAFLETKDGNGGKVAIDKDKGSTALKVGEQQSGAKVNGDETHLNTNSFDNGKTELHTVVSKDGTTRTETIDPKSGYARIMSNDARVAQLDKIINEKGRIRVDDIKTLKANNKELWSGVTEDDMKNSVDTMRSRGGFWSRIVNWDFYGGQANSDHYKMSKQEFGQAGKTDKPVPEKPVVRKDDPAQQPDFQGP